MSGDETPRFGHHLRRLREAAGLTQAELAERAGLSVKAISALERGERQRPYPHTIRAIVDALGLSDAEGRGLAETVPSRERTGGAVPGRPALPTAPTPLIGRDAELAEVAELLRGGTPRMVTLTGPGGVGKTRLALAVAQQLEHDFEGKVAFVPLAPLADAALVLPTIAQLLGLAEMGHTTSHDQLAAYLGRHDWLLVLDNVEHLLDISPEVAELLAACPNLRLLATSRAPLRIRAEHDYPLRPLALPDLSRVPTPDDLARVSSVQLFLARARAAAPAFALTQANCAAVAAICRRLDGLPLALELVAARIRSLGPTELLARLDHLLPLLSGSRDLPQRQQTMQATIDWSYQLLSPAGRTLFRRLAVFAGGWTLDAAEAVTAWGDLPADAVIDLLTGLVEQSLVVAEERPHGGTRYRMLELIRQFAARRVDAAGERAALADAHLAWCVALAHQAERERSCPTQQEWLDRLEEEHDNLRVALAWSQQDASRTADGLQLAADVWRFWVTRGYLAEGRRWLEQLLAAESAVPDDVRAHALNSAGNLARDQGDHAQARAMYEASLALRRELGDRHGIAIALNNLGVVTADEGDHGQSALLHEEALELFRAVANDWGTALSLHNRAIDLGVQGDYEQATALLDEAFVLWDQLGETSSRARSLDALGEVERRRGNLDRAASLHEESLRLRRELGDLRGIAINLKNLGLVANYRGDFAEAVRLIEESLRLRQEVGDRLAVAISLGALADVARHASDTTRARLLYQQGIAGRQGLGIRSGLADCLLGLAAISRADGDPRHAARLLGASDALREATSQPVAAIDRADYARIVAAIRALMSMEEYDQAVAAGRALTLEQVIAEALDGHDRAP